MKYIFAGKLSRLVTLSIILFSSMLNGLAFPTKATCVGPNCRAAVEKTAFKTPGCGSASCSAAKRDASFPAESLSRSTGFSQENWGAWVYLGDGVSVRFKIVKRNFEYGNPLWTWQFRNDLSSKITYLKFKYTEYKLPLNEDFTDVFPGNLDGYKAFGGWAAFTAVSSIQPSLRILEIERR